MTIAASDGEAVGRVEATAGRGDMRSAWSELPISEEAARDFCANTFAQATEAKWRQDWPIGCPQGSPAYAFKLPVAIAISPKADRKNGCLTSQLRIRDKSCWLRMSF